MRIGGKWIGLREFQIKAERKSRGLLAFVAEANLVARGLYPQHSVSLNFDPGLFSLGARKPLRVRIQVKDFRGADIVDCIVVAPRNEKRSVVRQQIATAMHRGLVSQRKGSELKKRHIAF